MELVRFAIAVIRGLARHHFKALPWAQLTRAAPEGLNARISIAVSLRFRQFLPLFQSPLQAGRFL